jgi:hypothetical protein
MGGCFRREESVTNFAGRPDGEAECRRAPSAERVEFQRTGKRFGAVLWVSRDDEAQDTQLPLLQFALGSLKSINGDKHRSRPVGTAKSACDDGDKRASRSTSRINMSAIKIPGFRSEVAVVV